MIITATWCIILIFERDMQKGYCYYNEQNHQWYAVIYTDYAMLEIAL